MGEISKVIRNPLFWTDQESSVCMVEIRYSGVLCLYVRDHQGN